jgi:hypothetical protein
MILETNQNSFHNFWIPTHFSIAFTSFTLELNQEHFRKLKGQRQPKRPSSPVARVNAAAREVGRPSKWPMAGSPPLATCCCKEAPRQACYYLATASTIATEWSFAFRIPKCLIFAKGQSPAPPRTTARLRAAPGECAGQLEVTMARLEDRCPPLGQRVAVGGN